MYTLGDNIDIEEESDNIENVIEFIRNSDTACVSFSQPRFKNKILALEEAYPNDVKIDAINKNGSITAHIPVRWIRISSPRQISEEQKKAASLRFKEMWEEKRNR